jgi:hypothetical protein
MLSIFMRFEVLRFRFGTARTEFDEWEGIDNRAGKNAATTCSAYLSSSSSDTVTLGVPYGTNYLDGLLAPALIVHVRPRCSHQ